MVESSVSTDFALLKTFEGMNAPEGFRAAEAQEIVRRFLDGKTAKVQPTVYAFGGGNGAGKSFFIEFCQTRLVIPTDAVLHDPDAVVAHMDAYNSARAGGDRNAFANSVWVAQHIANLIVQDAVSLRMDVLYQRTLATSQSIDLLNELQLKHSYKVELHLITSSLETAQRRVHLRGKETGLYMSPEDVEKRHRIVAKELATIVNTFPNCHLWRNDLDGQEPYLMASFVGKEATIFNEDDLKDFMKLASF